jgi:hypothetical protein
MPQLVYFPGFTLIHRGNPGSWITVAFLPQDIPAVHERYNMLENRVFVVIGRNWA